MNYLNYCNVHRFLDKINRFNKLFFLFYLNKSIKILYLNVKNIYLLKINKNFYFYLVK
jgi:hypothetical protein